jgi:hypothetical protein
MQQAVAVTPQRGLPAVSLNGAQLADVGLATAVGTVIAMPQYGTDPSTGFSWQSKVVGGPPASINHVLQGNDIDPTDPTAWFQVDVSTLAPGELRFVNQKPPRWMRTNLTALGAGGGAVSSTISV